ncbi:hypothetical protein FHS42_000022 [Streptomyces zagrosensis]|uniref:Uncharacterized protein n=1 Tax=Streptomyces zagrosensis TaxID=1042984 RepID=A0A7W9Q3N3_9ACTN|nr:hypothetical protein [Streptomyces zagrosensis]
MADDDEGAVIGQFLDCGLYQGRCPVGDLCLQFSATAPYRLAALPRRVLLAEARDDFVVGEPLPFARVRLAQGRIVRDIVAGDGRQFGGGRGGPPQVGRDDRVRLERGQQSRRATGLSDAGLSQLNVRGALEAAFEIPRGLAVPP